MGHSIIKIKTSKVLNATRLEQSKRNKYKWDAQI